MSFFNFFKKAVRSVAFIGMVVSLLMFARTINNIIVFKRTYLTESTVLFLALYIILAIIFASIYMKTWTGEWYLRSRKQKKS